VDEAAFDLHVQLPHAAGFVAAAKELFTHPVAGGRGAEPSKLKPF
jgi:quinol monooxygenase YgiN